VATQEMPQDASDSNWDDMTEITNSIKSTTTTSPFDRYYRIKQLLPIIFDSLMSNGNVCIPLISLRMIAKCP